MFSFFGIVIFLLSPLSQTRAFWGVLQRSSGIDSAAVSLSIVILVELTNTVFVNSTNISTNIETAVLSNLEMDIVV